ncbi:dihydroxy-acid dehydratase [Massilimaliae timonensis]|uniref:Dihydroxy-acid dehydratase n=1 Tax=Massiliimalia timonensis TaxID=1987501 RepID=A0A8J6PDM5_9FIRM|nr:dihydroxy-acid dehydratase [Massiliimalia timonensis]MBC8610546.1 dihydroxy-acid dehydratase [Massiliimalia timonensis]
MKTRSQDILHGPEWANVRALYKAGGYTDKELKRPVIGIVSSFNTICPGHVIFRQMTQRVREGIQAAGGMPVEFGTIGACDGIAMGHKGMRYILPTREMIANDIEAMAQAHRLDGLVLLGACDKIVPGMLMAAVRLNLPAVLVNGGPSLPGRMKENNPYGGEYIDHSIIQQSEGALKAGLIDEEQFAWIEDHAVPTIGSCAMLGTANTMGCLAEAMGLMLPGTATIPAVYSQRLAAAYQSGTAVMELVKQNLCPRDIITKQALSNAVRVNSAIGGSTNAVLHLLAVAYEAGVDFSVFEIGEICKDIPHMTPMIPAGKYTLLDFYEAGGIPAMMKELEPFLAMEQKTCTGKTLRDNLLHAKKYNGEVIRSLEDPVHRRAGIGILKGNLAPEGAVTKPSAIPDEALYFSGPAKIYEGEEEALAGIRAGQVQAGQVLVIRNEGPKGGPGMPEMYKAMKLLVGMDLGGKVCVVTDGRFSGSNNGCFVGHICPEAAEDGPIAYLQDGDIITVDVQSGLIEAPEVNFEKRRADSPYQYRRQVNGYLYQYAKNVKNASHGAVIPVCEETETTALIPFR